MGCVVKAIDADSITIFCSATNLVVCGQQVNLERLGWQLDSPTGLEEQGNSAKPISEVNYFSHSPDGGASGANSSADSG